MVSTIIRYSAMMAVSKIVSLYGDLIGAADSTQNIVIILLMTLMILSPRKFTI